MKNIVLKCLAPAALLGIMALPLVAQADPPHYAGINARLHRQDTRIDRGQHNDRLNGREGNRLEARDTRIARQEHRDRASNGGRLTWQERRHLQGELNHTSSAIYHRKHDGLGR